jgi:hypothetical protein
MPLKRSRDSLARPLIPARAWLRAAPPHGVSARWPVLAGNSDEDEDRKRRECREDESRPGRDADGERPEIDVRADPDRPEERDDTVVDGRGARHVRHVQDSNSRRERGFHKLQGLLWKCGKLNFCKLRPFRRWDPCGRTWPLLDSRLRRARSASRSKPEAKAVGGSRRSAEPVDESEIDSANERAALGSPFRIGPALPTGRRGCEALFEAPR